MQAFEPRLADMLLVIAVIVLSGLTLEYRRLIRRRLGLTVALAALAAGVLLTLSAVLPQNRFFGDVLYAGPTGAKEVALTFDDGPYPPYTGELLDVLREADVKATFFLIGRNAARYPGWVRRIQAGGHLIGSHTYDHLDLLKCDSRTAARQLAAAADCIAAITGERPRLARPPHGFRDPAVLAAMRAQGLTPVEWSVMSRDWTNPGAAAIAERTLHQVKDGSIILLHDGDGVAGRASRRQTVEAVRRIIAALRKEGYTFVTIEEMQEKRRTEVSENDRGPGQSGR